MDGSITTRGMPPGRKPMALVLQGGGALGAHEWGAIVRLSARPDSTRSR
jgi:predicted acylesterase/phospholipase RssA